MESKRRRIECIVGFKIDNARVSRVEKKRGGEGGKREREIEERVDCFALVSSSLFVFSRIRD